MKKCSKCGVEKDKMEFSKDTSRKDGKAHECKSCSRARGAKYRAEDAASIKTRKEKWYVENRDRVKAQSAERYLQNKNQIREKQKLYASENRDKFIRADTKYRIKNRGEIASRWAWCRATLHDAYIKRLFYETHYLKAADIPQPLIDLKRAQLKLLGSSE